MTRGGSDMRFMMQHLFVNLYNRYSPLRAVVYDVSSVPL